MKTEHEKGVGSGQLVLSLDTLSASAEALAAAYPDYEPWDLKVWLDQKKSVVRRNRVRALQNFPFIALPLVISPQRGMHPSIIDMIDNGEQLVSKIAQLADVRQCSIHALRKFAPEHFDWRFIHVPDLLRAFDVLPDENRPHYDDEWRLFQVAWQVLDLVGYQDWGTDHPVGDEIRVQLMREIMLAGPRKMKHALDGHIDELANLLGYAHLVNQWCRFVTRLDEFSQSEPIIGSAYMFGRLMARYDVTEIARQSVIWHRQVKTLSEGEYINIIASENYQYEPATLISTMQKVLPDYDAMVEIALETIARLRQPPCSSP